LGQALVMHRYLAGDTAVHGGSSWIGAVIIVAVAIMVAFLMVRAHRRGRQR
jgi:hypothetical protein